MLEYISTFIRYVLWCGIIAPSLLLCGICAWIYKEFISVIDRWAIYVRIELKAMSMFQLFITALGTSVLLYWTAELYKPLGIALGFMFIIEIYIICYWKRGMYHLAYQELKDKIK